MPKGWHAQGIADGQQSNLRFNQMAGQNIWPLQALQNLSIPSAENSSVSNSTSSAIPQPYGTAAAAYSAQSTKFSLNSSGSSTGAPNYLTYLIQRENALPLNNLAPAN